MVNILNNIISVFIPAVCSGCKRKLPETVQVLCVACRHELPITNNCLDKDNAVKRLFHGRASIQNANSFVLFHKKGIVQQIIHELKYKGQQQIGTFFGNWYGEILKENGVFNDVDIVIPVPLHKKRLKKRGYNQVTTFSQSLANKLGVEFDEISLKRIKNTSRQVFRSRGDRWQRLQNAFQVVDERALINKHILLVDDVITTGATLEACANILLKTRGTSVSIVTLAMTE